MCQSAQQADKPCYLQHTASPLDIKDKDLWATYKLSYLSAVHQEHTGHGQLYQHQDKQQHEKLESENSVSVSFALNMSCMLMH